MTWTFRPMNWTVPGILGAGVLAAVLMQNGGGLRVEPSNPVIPEPTNPIPEPTVPIPEPTNPVPEPASLIVMGLGVTGLIGRAMRIRSRNTK